MNEEVHNIVHFETLLKASDLLGIKIICKFEIE